MLKPIIAAQSYTVREYVKTPEGLEEALKKVREIGYEAVQVSGIGPIDADFVKNAADKENLKICATHIPFDRLKNDMEGVIRQHKLWDCKYVGIGSMPDSYRNSEEGYIQFAREASEYGKILNQNGLQLIYHNHSFEFRKFNGRTGMDILLEESDPESFQFEIDTYWVQAGGADPIAWIKRMQGRMAVVHFKDMIINNENKQTMAEVGEGNLNWKEIIDACIEIGVEWAAVEQDVCQTNAFDCLATSLSNLRAFNL